jgi:hypothetical protein
MSKKLDVKYYKIEVNDESKETKCTQIVLCEISNTSKKKHFLNFWNKYIKHFEIKRNHKVQYDYMAINYFYRNSYKL